MAPPGASCKLVVLGLPYSVDTQGLREYMSEYGQIEDVVVLKDRTSGRSRGFGYVTFSTPAEADKVAAMKHTLGGRDLEVKHATPKEEMQKPTRASTTRIFVGKVPQSVNEDSFRSFFEEFGTVTDAFLPKGPSPGTHRAIGFITFTSPDAVETVMSETRVLEGAELAIDKAVPKDEMGRGGAGGGGRGYGGGGYSGRGGYTDGGYGAGAGDAERYGAASYAAMYVTGRGAYRGAPPSASPYPTAQAAPSPYPPYDALSALSSYRPPPSLPPPAPAYPGSPAPPSPYSSVTPGAVLSQSGKTVHPTKIFVGKLAPETTVADLREYFTRFGPVEDIYLPKDPSKSGHRGFAFVTFVEEEVAAFVAKRTHTVVGRQVAIERATPQDGGQGGGRMISAAGGSAYARPSTESASAEEALLQQQLAPSSAYYNAAAQAYAAASGHTPDYSQYGGYSDHVGDRLGGRPDTRFRPY